MADYWPVGNVQNIILPPAICELLFTYIFYSKKICEGEYSQIVDSFRELMRTDI
jgi:hypothetical protein